jgi:chaperonin GroES
MDWKPVGDRLIIQQVEADEKTASGIVLPDSAKERPQKAKVLAVSEGRYEDGQLVPLSVKEGDEVLYSKYGGDKVPGEPDDILVLRESDILAKR